jgi:Lar family restriction alleviation protein
MSRLDSDCYEQSFDDGHLRGNIEGRQGNMTHRQMERYFAKELKPCPFCGGKAILVQWRDTKSPNATWAECKCGAYTKTSYSTNTAKAFAEAIKVWNRRAK